MYFLHYLAALGSRNLTLKRALVIEQLKLPLSTGGAGSAAAWACVRKLSAALSPDTLIRTVGLQRVLGLFIAVPQYQG